MKNWQVSRLWFSFLQKEHDQAYYATTNLHHLCETSEESKQNVHSYCLKWSYLHLKVNDMNEENEKKMLVYLLQNLNAEARNINIGRSISSGSSTTISQASRTQEFDTIPTLPNLLRPLHGRGLQQQVVSVNKTTIPLRFAVREWMEIKLNLKDCTYSTLC